jgi:5-methylcytosine-specific restriction endonuclease McrA
MPLTDRQREYREVYLTSDHWRTPAAEARKRAGNKCADCGKQRKLDVHHVTYDRLGNERPEDLVALCRACHNARHKISPAEARKHRR